MSTLARTQDQRMIGQKARQPEEEKGGLDARDLLARFRSKEDLYDYLSQHSKHSPSKIF
jgi:hypothetical protein